MLMRSEGDDHLDAVIDRAARSLTAAAPSTSLRTGVRDRIGRRWNALWLVPAAAAAVVIVVAFVLGRFSSPSGVPAVQPVPHPPALVTAPASVPEAAPDVRAVPAIATLPPMRRLVSAFELPPEELEPVIPPLTIEPLETRLLSVDTSSGVMPIEIEPLRIEPLQGE